MTHTFQPITRSDLDGPNVRFHAGDCTITYGKSGKAQPTVKSETWRPNGRVRTWKRDPERVELPIKYGMRGYSVIDAAQIRYGVPCFMHRADTCPVAAEAWAWYAARDTADAS